MYVNDGSKDKTWEMIKEINKKALEILAKDRTYILKGKCQDDLEIEI